MDAPTTNATRFAPKISKPEIAQLPIRGYDGEVEVVREPEHLERAVADLLAEPVALGFDTETRPAFRKGESYDPSIIQLATAERVYLVQIRHLPDWRALLPVLESPALPKAGVALDRDLKELRAMQPFVPGGFVELSELSDEHGIEANGLRPLTAIVLGFRISKGAQTTNWAAATLSEKQIRYAATDAWVGRSMYLALQGARPEIRSGQPTKENTNTSQT